MHLLHWLTDFCYALVGAVTGYALARWRRARATTQLWKFHPYGGGAPIEFKGSKANALAHCAKTHGPVMFTDELRGFIFYKPFGWKPSGV